MVHLTLHKYHPTKLLDIKFLSSLLFSMLLLMTAVGSGKTMANEQKVLIVGDSLSAAYGMPQHLGWVALLNKKLQKNGHPADIINASISGETTAGGLRRLPQLLDTYEPNLLIIELGGNDGLRGYSIQTMKQNLTRMIQLGLDSNSSVILMSMRIPPNYGTRYSNAFANTYSELGEQFNILVSPFFLKEVADNPKLMQTDGIHPNAQGQPQLLENVWPTFLEALVKAQ